MIFNKTQLVSSVSLTALTFCKNVQNILNTLKHKHLQKIGMKFVIKQQNYPSLAQAWMPCQRTLHQDLDILQVFS